MNSGKSRASLMGIVGGYLMYIAYELFRDRNQESTMTPFLRILFMVLFVIVGIALLVYAVQLWRNSGREEEEEKKRREEMNLK